MAIFVLMSLIQGGSVELRTEESDKTPLWFWLEELIFSLKRLHNVVPINCNKWNL